MPKCNATCAVNSSGAIVSGTTCKTALNPCWCWPSSMTNLRKWSSECITTKQSGAVKNLSRNTNSWRHLSRRSSVSLIRSSWPRKQTLSSLRDWEQPRLKRRRLRMKVRKRMMNQRRLLQDVKRNYKRSKKQRRPKHSKNKAKGKIQNLLRQVQMISWWSMGTIGWWLYRRSCSRLKKRW